MYINTCDYSVSTLFTTSYRQALSANNFRNMASLIETDMFPVRHKRMLIYYNGIFTKVMAKKVIRIICQRVA